MSRLQCTAAMGRRGRCPSDAVRSYCARQVHRDGVRLVWLNRCATHPLHGARESKVLNECVWLPWPDRLPVDQRQIKQLLVGDDVFLRHIARDNWAMSGTVTRILAPGRAVEVRPSEPITSPANWVIE